MKLNSVLPTPPSVSTQPLAVGQKSQGVTLVSVKPLADAPVAAPSRQEALQTFQSVAQSTLGKEAGLRLAGVPAANLAPLQEALGELVGASERDLTPAQLKQGTQALSQLNVAAMLLEPSMAHEMSPNDFAQNLVSHASSMEKQARAMGSDPALAQAASHLNDVAQTLRRVTQDNYLASGHVEPFSVKEAANFRALHYEAGCAVLQEMVDKLKTDLQAGGLPPEQQFKLEEQIEGLVAYQAELQTQADQFRSDKYQDNADKTADKKQIKHMMGGSLHKFQIKKINHFFGLIGARFKKAGLESAGRQGKPLPSSFGQVHIKSAMASHMRGRLQQLGLKGADVPSMDKLRGRIGDGYKDGVQQQPWRNIDRTHAMFAKGSGDTLSQVSFSNRMTRARDLTEDLKASYSADGLEGVSSLANKETRHVVNMWKTEYAPSQGGGFAFEGIRHGIHDAYKVKDASLRNEANDARVEEFIRASIQTASPTRFTRNQDGSLGIDIVSVSLVTPAAIGGDEKKMLANQVAAYERANQTFGTEGIEVSLPQPDGSMKTERVKPNIIAFNAGVNSFSLGTVKSPFFGGWGPSDRLNNASVKQLVGNLGTDGAIGGMAGRKIAALRQQLSDPAQAAQHTLIRHKIGVIQDLAQQVNTMLKEGLHHTAGNEPYKFPVRLLALANECDAAPAFNCKSGKDRTGQLDVEIKDFYTSLNVSDGQVRELNYRRSEAENLNLKTLFEHGGGREIQKHNTGVPGSKVDLKMFYNLFQFTDDKIDALKGLSKWVGA